MNISLRSLLADLGGRVLREAVRQVGSAPRRKPSRPQHDTSAPRSRPPRHGAPDPGSAPAGGYPGDFTGIPTLGYAPRGDDRPDPGEVVWAWVPFEEDHAQGKDRPVLLIGRDGEWLLGLPLTSKDHDRDAAQEARAGRHWIDVGSGAWDRRGRPSEARVDRIVRIAPAGVRRTGAALDRELFGRVCAEVLARR